MLFFWSFIYFFSYTRSLKCGQLQDWKTWVGVYVKCYCFSIFVVVDSVYYKYQYRITYTLCCGLNRLQVYVTEIKEKQIFERIQVANMSTFWVRFLQIRSACGWMSDPCCGHFGSQQGSFQRNRHGSAICKKRSQKCGVATLILSNICFSFISVTYTWSLFKPLHSVYVIWY